MKTFRLTERDLREGMTKGIGITNLQAKVIGVYPLKKGWVKRVVGKEISETEYSIYMHLSILEKEEAVWFYEQCLQSLRENAKICKHI